MQDYQNLTHYDPYCSKKKHRIIYLIWNFVNNHWENKYGAGENSNNLECVRKMDEMKKKYFFILVMINCIEQEAVQVTVLKQFTSSVDNGQQAVSAPHLSKLQHESPQQGNLFQSMLVRMLTSAKTEKSKTT